MGVTYVAADFLLAARARGVNFGSALTIGRQWLVLSPYELMKLLRKHGLWREDLSEAGFLEKVARIPYYLDPLLHCLGASKVDSLDVSEFEGASMLHDMNQPIPREWAKRFDLVFDGGSLEHIFNFPAAIENYMNLVKVGGTLMIFTVANNFCGHGFYQFSPELFYRVLCPENGFELKRLVAVEDDMVWSKVGPYSFPINLHGKAYEVNDPAAIAERVELVNRRQVALLVEARRIKEEVGISPAPQQSDYKAAWKEKKDADLEQVKSRAGGSALSRITSRLTAPQLLHLQQKIAPGVLKWINPFLLKRWGAKETFSNKKAYKRISKW